MKTGMLWFDENSGRDLGAKIERAARHYEAKYGMFPDLCYVHPSMLATKALEKHMVEVKPSNNILPNHLWIGVRDAALSRRAA